jgi:hypothetical protein
MMTLFDRFYFYGALLLTATTVILMLKPMLLVFMLIGLAVTYMTHYAFKHPEWGHLLARVVAECLGLLLMLAFFVTLMVFYGQFLGH